MPRSRRLAVDGSWVTIDVHGDPDGRSIVVVPGVMADAAWGPVADALDAWDAAVVINRRGRRPSGPLTDRYSLATEVPDLGAVLAELADVATILGWSYGGLITLHLAQDVAAPHLVAYEPVIAPFGARTLPALRRAHEAGDATTATVDVALREVAGIGEGEVAALRSRPAAWSELERLGSPLYAEALAINEVPPLRDSEHSARALDEASPGCDRGPPVLQGGLAGQQAISGSPRFPDVPPVRPVDDAPRARVKARPGDRLTASRAASHATSPPGPCLALQTHPKNARPERGSRVTRPHPTGCHL